MQMFDSDKRKLRMLIKILSLEISAMDEGVVMESINQCDFEHQLEALMVEQKAYFDEHLTLIKALGSVQNHLSTCTSNK